uniref:Zincin-like metallopeptidase domain-containing protein n=1 Tax=Roseihalotalea indica TaxID=2867963 RepID=A0AA49GRQ7_9BACT|nr:zincin-like metallopeptidase domain-containing protein [Tunicatimonas sp. TK19036]
MKKTHKSQSRQDAYQLVTDIIIHKLEQGVIPWKKSWSSQGPAANYLTKKAYRGINALLLNSPGAVYPYFLTFRQAQKLGGMIRKGAQSLPVVYWQWYYTHKETGRKLTEEEAKALPSSEVERSAFLRYYRVFNIQDTEGIDLTFPATHTFSLENDKLMQGFQPLHSMPHSVAVKTQSNSPYYHPRHDYINMPAMTAFPSMEAYFQVLYHELIHATGHSKRLNRSGVSEPQPFGSWTYSQEELIAEMGASFLSNLMGMQNEEELNDAASYIQGWLKVLKNDKRFVIEAAQKAQRATDYIMGYQEGAP